MAAAAQELNGGSRRSGGGGSVADTISKAAVGVLSVMLQAYEMVDNGIDSACWAANLGAQPNSNSSDQFTTITIKQLWQTSPMSWQHSPDDNAID